jgi:hypothetical protein
MGETKPTILWVPQSKGIMTRYIRAGAGKYNLRRVMDPAPAGKPQRPDVRGQLLHAVRALRDTGS